jgi:hypothetical protein
MIGKKLPIWQRPRLRIRFMLFTVKMGGLARSLSTVRVTPPAGITVRSQPPGPTRPTRPVRPN